MRAFSSFELVSLFRFLIESVPGLLVHEYVFVFGSSRMVSTTCGAYGSDDQVGGLRKQRKGRHLGSRMKTVIGSCVKLGAHEGEEAGSPGRACVGAEFARVWWRGRCVSPRPISGHVILVCRVESSPFDQ